MKTHFLTLVFGILLAYIFVGLQASLYRLPFPAPALWVVVFCYMSFFRPLILAVAFNTLLTLILCQYSALNPIPLILVLNGLTFLIKSIQNRFHLNTHQIAMSIGIFTLAIHLGLYLGQSPQSYSPQILSWVSQSLSTAVFAPILFYPLIRWDVFLPTDPMDGMELFIQ